MAGATLCIDAGTSLIKAVVFDEDGDELAVASRSTAILSPRAGYAEQDLDGVMDAVRATVREAAAGSPLPIGRIAITAQGDGLWPLTAELRPAGPAVLWSDGRAVDIVEAWKADGVLDEAFRRTGALGNLGLPHALLRWAAENRPDAIAGMRWAATCGSWIFASLTGTVGLHVSEASAPWLEVGREGYSDELLELYGLAQLREVLPPLLDDRSSVQPLRSDVAESLGVAAGVPVVMAPYDVVATGIGSGAISDGDAFCILGTTLCTGVVRDSISTEGTPTGLTLLTTPSGPYIRAFPTLAGTGVVDWMARTLGLEGAPGLAELAAGASPDFGGAMVWPYLSPSGERSPFLDPTVRGSIGGVTLETTRADLAAATLDGLAHVVRECLDVSHTQAAQLSLAGGGAASGIWRQAIADVTGVPTRRPVGAQVGARGALVVAAALTGDDADIPAAAARLVRTAEISEPDPAATTRASLRHADFLAARAALSSARRAPEVGQ